MRGVVFGYLAVGIVAATAYLFYHDAKPSNVTTLAASPELALTMTPLTLTSPAFDNNGTIPSQYTCDGDRTLNPPLEISGVPKDAQSLALIMDDPDVPTALMPSEVFDHWIVYNIPPDTTLIPEHGPIPGTLGVNGAGDSAYTGPCPPTEYEPREHRYVFRLYALNASLTLLSGLSKSELLDEITPHTIAQAELIGRYARK